MTLRAAGPGSLLVLAVSGAALSGPACSEVAGGAADTSPATSDTAPSEPVALDVLWVIDPSAGFCQEQRALADGFPAFLEVLGAAGLDVRLAFTGMDVQCSPTRSNVGPVMGAFATRSASGWPPSCQEKIAKACMTDEECAGLDCTVFGKGCDDPSADGKWICRKARSVKCVVRPNGSVQTQCKRTCTSDDECRDLFDDPRYICQMPSGNMVDWGCVIPPAIEDCPETLGPVLAGDELALGPCLVRLGVNQNKCFKYEQGFAAALLALDPAGPNAASLSCTPSEEAAGTCRRFLRDGAWLAVVLASNNDDCSSVSPIDEDEHETCALLPDADHGGPLLPVASAAEALAAFKPDGRVLVATLSGNAVPGGGTLAAATGCEEILASLEAGEIDERTAQRQCYLESKGSPILCYMPTTICQGPLGGEDFGARYLALAEAFGSRGRFHNLCGAGDGSGLAAEIAEGFLVGMGPGTEERR